VKRSACLAALVAVAIVLAIAGAVAVSQLPEICPRVAPIDAGPC